MAKDSEIWERAYKSYKKHLPKVERIPVKNSSVRTSYDKKKWLETQREFLRWKKTTEYEAWRKKQFGRQDGKCYYCNCDLRGIKTDVEHVIPKSKGGTNKPSNLVLACWKCNKDKNSRLLSRTETRQYRKIQKKKVTNYRLAREAEEKLALELRTMFCED